MNIYIICANDYPYVAYKDKDKAHDECKKLQEAEDKTRNKYSQKVYYHVEITALIGE